jgi:hypothetical protein
MLQQRQNPAAPVKEPPASTAAPELTGVAKIQKFADDSKLQRMEKQTEEYKKRWADTIGKGDAEATKKAWDVYSMLSAEHLPWQDRG